MVSPSYLNSLASSVDARSAVSVAAACRLFDEARYRDAAAEFEWASDLYGSAGREEQSGISRRAMERARKVHAAQASIWDQHP
jgi:hypothetical protein